MKAVAAAALAAVAVGVTEAEAEAAFSRAQAMTSGRLLLYFLTTFLKTSETILSTWLSGELTGRLEIAAWAAL